MIFKLFFRFIDNLICYLLIKGVWFKMCLMCFLMLFGSCGFDVGGFWGIYLVLFMGKNRYESKRYENIIYKVIFFVFVGF